MSAIEPGFEIVGLVEFPKPYRVTERGDELVARFTAKYGVLSLTGLMLWRGRNGKHYTSLGDSPRDERAWITSQIARDELTKLAVQSKDRPPNPKAFFKVRADSLKTAPREGNSNGAGYARAGVTSNDAARD